MQAEENIRLLTAHELQAMLLQIFEDYRNSRKPSFLIDKPAAVPVLHSDDELADEAQDAPKSTPGVLGTIGSFFKSVAVLAIEHGTRKHSTLTKFITEEMADILNQRGASPLKVMTDLTILYHGLRLYMLTRHSVTLSPLLDNVNQMIWPYKGADRRQFVYKQVVFGQNSEIRISKDNFVFLNIFKSQIERARDLISHSTTLSDKSHTSGLRNPANPLFADNMPEWQYRCSEVGSNGSNDVDIAPEAWMGDAYSAFLSNEAPRAEVAATAPNRNFADVD